MFTSSKQINGQGSWLLASEMQPFFGLWGGINRSICNIHFCIFSFTSLEDEQRWTFSFSILFLFTLIYRCSSFLTRLLSCSSSELLSCCADWRSFCLLSTSTLSSLICWEHALYIEQTVCIDTFEYSHTLLALVVAWTNQYKIEHIH